MQYMLIQAKMPQINFDRNAPEPVHFAAAELERYLRRILSAGKTDPSARQIIRLELKPDEALRDEGYDLVAESPELFRIRAGGPAGIVFGVYEFLRRYGGCRFSGLGPDGEHVPERAKIAIPLGTLRRTPQLWYRGLQFSGLADPVLRLQRLDWMAKNGLNYVMLHPCPETAGDAASTYVDPATGEVRTLNSFWSYTNTQFRQEVLPEIRKRGLKCDMNHHNLFYWLPPEKYFAEHPEWFALLDGARSKERRQLCICTSNAQALQTLIANILQYLRDNPETKIVGVIPEDDRGMCQCAECLKLDGDAKDAARSYGGHRSADGENRAKSRRYALLLNEVARAVRREFPNVKVGGAAYVDLQWPPRDIRLESNIVIWVAIYWRCGAHELAPHSCRMNEFFWDILKQWRSSQTCEIILYEYYMGMNGQRGLPYPMGDVICREWPRIRQELGIRGATVQSREDSHNTYALNYLAFARCGWEEHLDYQALKDEFLQGMFGAAADVARPVYDLLDRQARALEEKGSDSFFVKPVPPAVGCLLPNARNVGFLLEPLDGAQAMARIEQALRTTAAAREQRQLKDFLDALRYWIMMRDFFRTAYEITAADERGDKAAARALAGKALEAYEPLLRNLPELPERGWIVQDKKRNWLADAKYWGSPAWMRALLRKES